MNLGLKSKTALVSGSTAGIGLAIAAALAAEGAKVIINGRTKARVDAALDQLQKRVKDAEFHGVAADLSVAGGLEPIARQNPRVDILVNNLGIFEAKTFFHIPDDDWKRLFEVNVLSGVRLTRHYLPGMLERNWGRVIFISSESAQQIPAEMIHYGMTKTAQVAVARGLAESFPNSGVTFNSILAGPTASEGVGEFVSQMAAARGIDAATVERQFFETARPSSVLKRFATPDEVAAMITFVCSVQASATTGAALRVDGGVVRAIV